MEPAPTEVEMPHPGESPPGESPPGEPRPADSEPLRPRSRHWLIRGLIRLGQGLLALLILFALFALYQWLTWPDVEALAGTDPESTAFIDAYKAREQAAGRPGKVAWHPVPYGRISNHLKHAVVVAEDIDFFSHQGFAWEEMKKAVEEARQEGKPPRGASTLTQQLAKNLWLSPSRNPWRKVREALLTMALEKHLKKRRILELYLNVAEFGPGIYGAEAAARHYFGKAARDLSPREAAELASGLPRPSTWHPGSTSATYRRRVEKILGRMERTDWVRREL